MSTEHDLDLFLNATRFDPNEALQDAQIVLERKPDSDKAHFVAFMANAELFAETQAHQHQEEALRHYREAIALNPSLRLFPDDFKLLGLIGVGGFSYVFQVSRGVAPLALKALKQRAPFSESTWRVFTDVLTKLAACHSDHVVNILEFSEPGSPYLYYVMDYIEGQSLRPWIESRVKDRDRLQSRHRATYYLEAVEIALQIAKGLNDAQECGVPHLDLKPENILIHSQQDTSLKVTLVDFNFMSIQRRGLPYYSLLPFQTTLAYCAPEVIPNISNASFKSDIYSLGLLIIEMLGGDIGLRSIFDELTYLASEVPVLAVLVLACIDKEPSKRPSYQKVIEELNEIRKDLLQKEKEVKAITDSNIAQRILKFSKPVLGIPIIDFIISVLDTVHRKPGRQVEWSIGVAVPPLLLGWLIRVLSGGGPPWKIANDDFIPAFIAATSFTLIMSSYFMQLAFRCQFWKKPWAELLRFSMSWCYGVPVFLAALLPNFWPFLAATGTFMVGTNNLAMWKYAREYRQYSPEILHNVRHGLIVTLLGYALSGYVFTIALLAGGAVLRFIPEKAGNMHLRWWVDLGFSVIILLVLLQIYITKIRGESSKRIWTSLSMEYTIRAKTDKYAT